VTISSKKQSSSMICKGSKLDAHPSYFAQQGPVVDLIGIAPELLAEIVGVEAAG
jgi:hypothetical protein